MASTLKPYDAFDYAKHFLKDMNLEKVQTRILDDVGKIMWMAAPWRWTIGSMPLVTLVASTTDYTVSVPGDLLYLQKAYLTDGSTTRELRVEPVLPTLVTIQGQPSHVSLTGTTMRVSPLPGSQQSPAPKIVSLYKKMAPVITTANASTAGTQVFDDEWFWVYQEGVLWRAYMYGDDSRAGTAQVASNGQITFNGQRGVFEAGIQFMKANEKLPLPDLREGK